MSVAPKGLLIGSGNRDKVSEVMSLLADTPRELRRLVDFDPVPEPEETEETFEGNALLKARYYASHAGISCVADDSGIEVDALGGAPGVYSARYAGPGCTYADNNGKLREALAGKPVEERGARYVCCAAYAGIDGEEHVVRGTIEGTIADEPRGANGFGYDPVFIPSGFDQTFGELDSSVKADLSHRAQAFRKLAQYLAQRPISSPGA